MRHGMAGNKFGRNQKLRQATLRDLAKAVFTVERIKTTQAKAIEARKLVDKLITLGKQNTLAAKRAVFSVLCDHTLVSRIFNVIAPRFKNRQGGYTRLIKFTTNRQGDNAQMVLLELTERDMSIGAEKKIEDAQVVETAADTKAGKAVKAEKKPAVKKAEAKKPEAKKAEVKKPAKKEAVKK